MSPKIPRASWFGSDLYSGLRAGVFSLVSAVSVTSGENLQP